MGRKVVELRRSSKPTKQLKRVCLIVAEGENQTETLYFNHYKKRNNKLNLKIESAHFTDSYNLVKRAEILCKNNDISPKDGDAVFCLIDTDNDLDKKDTIEKAIQYANKKKYKVILSSPCFEIWFLNHFIKTTKDYTNTELLDDLGKHIKNYSKSKDIWEQLYDKQKKAFENTHYQNKYHQNLGKSINRFGANPSTMVSELIEFITDNG